MKLVCVLLCVLMVGGFAPSLFAQIRPPNTGKLSWDLFQEAVAGQRVKAIGERVPVISALLTTTRPVTAADLTKLRDLEYNILGVFGHFVLVEAPADSYADPQKGIDVLDFVANATLPPTAIEKAYTAITCGTTAIRADAVWTLGYRGQGQKVAVIDSGYDPENPTLAQMNPTYFRVIPSGDSPGAYRVEEGKVEQTSLHGTSCAIIVGDVAPEAKLYLLSYPARTSIVGWLCALDFAVHKLGVSVVSTSLEFSRPTCHADGTGRLNEVVNGIFADSNAVLVIASGNWAAGSGADRWFYAGTFTDSDGNHQHDFTSSTDAWDRNTLRFEGRKGRMIWIILEWDDWNRATGTVDLDLYLYDDVYKELLAQSRTQQYGQTTDPFELVFGELPYTGTYAIVIEDRTAKWHGQPARQVSFHLNAYCASNVFPQVEHHTVCGSVREVATNPNPWVIAVGAVSEDGTVRSYSSRGPISSRWSSPALLAPDGVKGTVYPVFYGTSASAPYVAGTIALLYSTGRVLLRDDLIAILRESADALVDNCGNLVYRINAEAAIKLALSR